MATADPLHLSVPILLSNLGKYYSLVLNNALVEQGTSLRNVTALDQLKTQPGSSYSELARQLGITVQSVQATVLQLEAEGLVERVSGGGRGRTTELRVTSDGERILEGAAAAMNEAEDDVLTALSQLEADALRVLLVKLS